MSIVYKHKDSKNIDEICAASVLHDTIEDTGTTYEEILKLFDGMVVNKQPVDAKLIADLVQELTSDPAELKAMGKRAYIDKKLYELASYGRLIKLADILANAGDSPSPNMVKRFRHHHDYVTSPNFGKELTVPHRSILREIDYTLRSVYNV